MSKIKKQNIELTPEQRRQLNAIVIPPTVREQLADYAHKAWSGWMKYMFGKMTINEDGTATMPKWAVDRWTFQMNKTYNELPDDMKESDRQEADRIISIIKAV